MTPSEEQVRAAVAQQAGTWFVANQSGPLEQAERAAFVTWLKASPIHVEEYLGIALIAHDLPTAADDPGMSLESLLDMARADNANGVVAFEMPLQVRESAPRRINEPRRWSLAAAIAAGLLVTGALWWLHDGELLGLPKTYETGHGKQSIARLPDGSELRLNTDSEVVVRYAHGERVLELERGQALFTVAHGDARPFRVAAGEAQVLAVGTQFDVYRQRGGTVVTVVEGTVGVLVGEPPRAGTNGIPAHATRVEAGYQLRIDARALSDQPIPVNVGQAEAWQHRKIAFERRPLGEVADEFNRYGPIPIEIDDATLRALPISGVFDADDTDSFVAFLKSLEGVRVERTPARIRVFRADLKKE